MDIDREVELAIDLATRDVARAFAAAYSAEFPADILRTVRGYMCMAVSKAAMDADESSWTSEGGHPLWTSADGPQDSIDDRALTRAIGRWWDGLDAKRQLDVIMGPAGHHKSEYTNALVQKYRDKPESDLMRDIPDLAEAYRSELSARRPWE